MAFAVLNIHEQRTRLDKFHELESGILADLFILGRSPRSHMKVRLPEVIQGVVLRLGCDWVAGLNDLMK